MFKRGDLVEFDGLLAVVVGTAEDGSANAGELALWFGEPKGLRKSKGGRGGLRPEVWTVPLVYCTPAAEPVMND
ncbi:MAG: Sinac [Pedosphaera sp.]|nr:Sinac [Pedosphaera sp.]